MVTAFDCFVLRFRGMVRSQSDETMEERIAQTNITRSDQSHSRR